MPTHRATTNALRFLLIDPSRAMRSILRKILANLVDDVAFRDAADPQDALSRAAAWSPDLVVLDWDLPDNGSPTFLDQFRLANRKTPVLVILGDSRATRPAIVHAIQAGADGYLLKPFTPADLTSRVSRILARRRTPPIRVMGPAARPAE